MIIVDVGPRLLSLDVPKKGKMKFAENAIVEDMNIPRKQYLICMRSSPIEFLYEISKKSNPPIILARTNIPKNG